MSTTTANMGLTVPALNGDPGVWDSALNASLALLDLHDHSSGKGVRVPSAGIGIDANLTFAGYSITNLRANVYTAQVSFATALSTYVIGNDLYFRDGASNQIRLTSSGAINIATTGGIAGDYIGAGAQVYYDDGNSTYRMLEAAPAPNDWSRVACGGVDLYERASGITNRVRLSSPAALAASYEVTFPAALPADTYIIQMSSAGALIVSDTIQKSVTFTNLVTLTAGATAAANQSFTVSGTGAYKHGSQKRPVSAQTGIEIGGTGHWSSAAGYVISDGTVDVYWAVPIPLDVGERITALDYRLHGEAATANWSLAVKLYAADMTVSATIGSASNSNESNAWTTYAIAGLTATTIATGQFVVAEFRVTTAEALRIGTLEATYTRP